ncbi:MAG: hypothetical protein J1F67_10980 [Muribaculaceae bacterium]|nr:hypothetical protein [Muribaculaceae bacterium]
MKKSNIIKASLLVGVMFAASSCTEEKIYGLDPNGIPEAGNYVIKAEVNQETNKVSLMLTDKNGNPAVGVFPVWKVYTKATPVRSTRPVYTDIVTLAGDYDIEAQVANRNGVSDGVLTGTFHIENTMVDFSPYILFLTNNETKKWQIAANEQGHLGCGESGTDGLNWWSASPYDKKDWGVYENRMIFTDNGGNGTGEYTFDPGESGTIYINKEITDLPPYSAYNTNDDNDYCAPAEVQNTTFTISPEGNDLYLVFPQGTLMAYLPNMDQWNNPKWKIIDINKNKVELVCDNGGIAWHYLLQPEGADAGDKPFEGFKYDSEFNLWKNANVSLGSTWFSPSDWSGSCAQPAVEVTNELIKFHTPADMGSDQWQGQVHILTDIQLSAASNYDFSIKVTAPVDALVTVKPHKAEGDDQDNVFLTADRASFDAGGSYYYVSAVPGWDGGLTLTLDVAGYPDTDFEISKIVIKDHANDDGTVLPSDSPSGDGDQNVSWVDVNSPDNLWNPSHVTEITSWTSPSDWSGSTPEPEITQEGNTFIVQYSEAPGGDQWQAQVVLHTDLAFSSDKSYDVRLTINPSCDISGATVKFTQEDNDDVYWTADRHDLQAYEDNVISLTNLSADLPQLKVVFDFAGVTENAKVEIKDIIVQEHTGPAVADWVDVNSDENLMNTCEYFLTYWYAPGWNQIDDPETEINGASFTLTLPYATTDQWMAQFAIHTNITTSADKNYDFRMTLYSTTDIPGVTFKVTEDGNDDKFYMSDRVPAVAYEEVTYEWVNLPGIDIDPVNIFFDFGGCPDNTKVTIKDIIFQEHR